MYRVREDMSDTMGSTSRMIGKVGVRAGREGVLMIFHVAADNDTT